MAQMLFCDSTVSTPEVLTLMLFTQVAEGQPSALAGLLPGDIILEVKGIPTPNVHSYYAALKDVQPGDTLRLMLLRQGMELSLPLVIGARGHSIPYTLLIQRMADLGGHTAVPTTGLV